MAYWKNTEPMKDDQLELYRRQFPDGELNIPEPIEGNWDVIGVYNIVQNQLVVNGQVIDFDLQIIMGICELLEYSKQRTLLIIEKFRTIKDILFPIKKAKK